MLSYMAIEMLAAAAESDRRAEFYANQTRRKSRSQSLPKCLTRGIVYGSTALLALTPFAAHAQQTASLSSDEVRRDDIDAGYRVGPPSMSWTDGSTTFIVGPTADSGGDLDRVLTVTVYPNPASCAQNARGRAQASTVWWQNVDWLSLEGVSWTSSTRRK